MDSSGLRREEYLLTVGILRLDDRYADLPLPGRVLQLTATNVRNRPLRDTDVSSMRESVMSLYHNLVTGSRDFPVIPFRGSFRFRLTTTPFAVVEPERTENTRLHSLLEEPPGILVPTAGSASSMVLTPALPEKADLGAVWADHRNRVRCVKFDDRSVTRVISLVSTPERTEVVNRWRVTDYRADGQVLMSILCRFTTESAQCANTERRKRKDTDEDGCSNVSPPKKRIRV